MESLVEEPADREAYIKLANYPLIKHTDMESEMRSEAVEICTGAIEKFPGNQEKSAQLIKVREDPPLRLLDRAQVFILTHDAPRPERDERARRSIVSSPFELWSLGRVRAISTFPGPTRVILPYAPFRMFAAE